MKRLLVSGGTGFIGSHFLRLALAKGHEVWALRRPGSETRIALDSSPHWIDGCLADLPTRLSQGRAPKCDVFVHFAAVGLQPATASWEACFRTNVMESLAAWRAALEQGVRRLVICGSCFEYGASGERYQFIPTSAPLMPTGPYHASKAAASMAAIGLAEEREIECAVLRPFHVFGDGQDPSCLWPSLRAAALTGDDFPMTLGEQVRDFVPVEDAVSRFLFVACENTLTPGAPEIHNIGSGSATRIIDFAERWWRHWNARGQLRPGAIDYRRNEVMRYVPEVSP